MSLGIVTNVAIGLIFVYLLLGLIASALQEAIAGWLNWRGTQLHAALANLLERPFPDVVATARAALDAAAKELEGLGADAPPPSAAAASVLARHSDAVAAAALFEKVFRHGLIAPDASARLPSYVSSQNFRMALFAALTDGSATPMFAQLQRSVAAIRSRGLRDSLTALLADAGGDLDKLSKSVEKWFDDAMDRASGIYKRLASKFMLIFGLVVAVGANVNTIVIADFLWKHPLVSAALADSAQQFEQSHPDAGKVVVVTSADAASAAAAPSTAASSPAVDPIAAIAQARANYDALDALPVPIGYPLHVKSKLDLLTLVAGWLMTALAVSLGAPFWFDTLQKFLNIRNAGPKPDRSDGETQH